MSKIALKISSEIVTKLNNFDKLNVKNKQETIQTQLPEDDEFVEKYTEEHQKIFDMIFEIVSDHLK